MEIILCNAFSIAMLPSRDSMVKFTPIGYPEGVILENWVGVNAIGHPDTDEVVRTLLEQGGVSGLMVGKRVNVTLQPGQGLLVAQYKGPRLPEGATKLPEGATIEWWLVELVG